MKIENYWSTYLGVSSDLFNKERVIVVPHKALKGFNGAWIFNHQKLWLISVPNAMVDPVKAKLKLLRNKDLDLFETTNFKSIFEVPISKIIGPAFQGYYEELSIEGNLPSQVIALDQNHHKKQIERLANSGDPTGWSHSGAGKHQDYLFAYVQEGKILSIANYKLLGEDVGFIGVYTHPNYRGKGFGQAVVLGAVKDLLAKKKLVLYQTLMSNSAAVALAKRLGVKEFAQHIAIRFS